MSIFTIAPSLALILNKYVPAAGNVAVVTGVFVFENVTPAVPVNCTHVIFNPAGGTGNPSSVANPSNCTLLVGNVITLSGPALNVGAWFVPLAENVLICTVSLLVNDPSLTVNSRLNVAALGNAAVVVNELGLLKTTPANPDICFQLTVNVPPGNPSSVAVPVSVAWFGNVIF